MSRRTTRRQRGRESQSAQKRRLTARITWVAGLAVVALGLVAGGIFFANSKGSQDLLLSTDGREVGRDYGDLIPDFDIRLVNGTTVNSTELVIAKKPVFYYFFATW